MIEEKDIKKQVKKESVKTSIQKKIPLSIKIISVLFYISAGASILSGLIYFLNIKDFSALPNPSIMTISMSWSSFYIFGIGNGILIFIISLYLRKLQNWARILGIFISCIGMIIALFSIMEKSYLTGVYSLIFNGLVAGYLLFNSRVKQAFV